MGRKVNNGTGNLEFYLHWYHLRGLHWDCHLVASRLN